MTKEEAAEIVLKGNPWEICGHCSGLGNFDCTICSRQGYRLSASTVEAYELLGVGLPPRPLTPSEHIANALADRVLGELRRPSIARRLFPPQMVSDDKPKKESE